MPAKDGKRRAQRSPAKAAQTLAGVAGVQVLPLDLMDAASIDAFAQRVLSAENALHLLINCAGVMAAPLTRDARGYEGQLVANHLGHFQLTAQLWPALVRASGARVIAYSSRGHRIAPFHFDDWNFQVRDYNPWLAYGQAKTANALFALALDALGTQHKVRAFSVHPGTILTPLARHLNAAELKAFGIEHDSPYGFIPSGKSLVEGGDYKSIAQGAATGLWCATSTELDGLGGVYCENINIAHAVDADAASPEGVRPWACDPLAARELWTLSEQLTGVSWR